MPATDFSELSDREKYYMATVLYQGHSSFRMVSNSGLVIYIDPYKGGGYNVPADVILVTHQHFDHNRVDQVEKRDDCTIITNFEAYSDGEYNSFEINDVLIEAVPAYNKNHKKEECVGYIISVDDSILYFPGDTGITEEMKDYPEKNIDIFFIPMDGVYTMTLEEAKQCCDIVQPKYCVPIHTAPQYDKEDDSLYDLETAEKFEGKIKVIIKPGENFVI